MVEDSASDARLVRELLAESELGQFELVHVETLGEARAHLAARDFHAALLDLSLPDAEGLKALTEILDLGKEVAVIVLTGRNDEELALQAVQVGAQDYLVKGLNDGPLLKRCLRHAVERKRLEAQVASLARTDELTGLANRAESRISLDRALARSARSGDHVALLYIDLDGFKEINDVYGHEGGDAILSAVAERLRHAVRKTDTVCRLGGDEFVIICEDVTDPIAAGTVARKVIDTVSVPIRLGGYEASVGSSIGVALYPGCARNAETLMRAADAAMYRAKASGRNTYRFAPSSEANVPEPDLEHRRLYDRLCRALEREEFVLHYQPQVDLHSGELIGAEALVRWQDPDQGLVRPDDFIPFAERSGLILPLSEWLLRAVSAQVASWAAAGLPSIRVWVKACGQLLDDPQALLGLLDGVPGAALCVGLECPQKLLEATQSARTDLACLRARGLALAVDDFGTGNAALQTLRDLPVDVLRIDGSFVRHLPESDADGAMVRAMAAFGRSLGLYVVAERVETLRQAELLRDVGCHAIQGFLLSQPLPAEVFTAWRRSFVRHAEALTATR